MQSLSFVTVCVGKPYIDYFSKVIKSYELLSLPKETKIWIATNHVEYCQETFKESPLCINTIDFSPILDHYKIKEKDYRDNDCIKVRAFIEALYVDINDFLFYVDGDMLAHLYNELFDVVFNQEGFYHELCHTYDKEEDIEEHTFKRIRQIRNLGFEVEFMKNEKGQIIFPIERFWGLKRTFCGKELQFAEEFNKLFELLISEYRNDLYTECVEMGHCFSKFFKKNKHINQGLAFSETSGVTP